MRYHQIPSIATIPYLILHLYLFLTSTSAHPYIASSQRTSNNNAALLISDSPFSQSHLPHHIRPRDDAPSTTPSTPPLLYITSWQPISPDSSAQSTLLSLLTALEIYLGTLSPSLDTQLTPSSPLNLLYGSLQISLSLHPTSPPPSKPKDKNKLKHRRFIPYTNLSTTQKLKIILKEMGKGYVEGFVGCGKFFWDWGGGYIVALRLMVQFGPPGGWPDERALLFGGMGAGGGVRGFRQRHIVGV